MNQAPFADSVPVAQPEARSLLDSPCLNQLFCKLRLFLAALKMPPSFLPAAARSCLAGSTSGVGWVANGWPELRRILIEQLDGGADGSKAVRLLAEVLQALGAEFPAALLRQADCSAECLNRGSASPPAAAPSGPVQGAGPLRRKPSAAGGFGAVWLCNPGGPDGIPILCKPTPVPQPCFFCYPSTTRESPHQTVVEFVRRVLQTGMLSLLKHVASTSGASPAARPVGLCCILNIDRYEQADAPTQFHRRQGSACDVENISRVFKKLGYQILRSPNTTDEPDLLMTREKCIDFRDECFDEFGAWCVHQLRHPMFSRQPKLFVFQFCRGEFVNFYTDGPSQEQSQPGTPAGHLQMNRSYTEYAEAQMEAHRPVMLNELMASVNRQLTQQNDDGIPLQPVEVKNFGWRLNIGCEHVRFTRSVMQCRVWLSAVSTSCASFPWPITNMTKLVYAPAPNSSKHSSRKSMHFSRVISRSGSGAIGLAQQGGWKLGAQRLQHFGQEPDSFASVRATVQLFNENPAQFGPAVGDQPTPEVEPARQLRAAAGKKEGGIFNAAKKSGAAEQLVEAWRVQQAARLRLGHRHRVRKGCLGFFQHLGSTRRLRCRPDCLAEAESTTAASRPDVQLRQLLNCTCLATSRFSTYLKNLHIELEFTMRGSTSRRPCKSSHFRMVSKLGDISASGTPQTAVSIKAEHSAEYFGGEAVPQFVFALIVRPGDAEVQTAGEHSAKHGVRVAAEQVGINYESGAVHRYGQVAGRVFANGADVLRICILDPD
uniref:CASPASE_P20 domain-containing protein n=1 Tax=Macrostomum lignano TaxID=282301 RepID=A0A1I8FFJ1_9PLAT